MSFVPTYAYVGLDKIDLAAGPDATELGAAVEAALRAGFTVVIKPHLDPPAYQPGFDPFKSDNHSWRVMCPWRGFYDLDPMAPTTATASCSRRCACSRTSSTRAGRVGGARPCAWRSAPS